MQLKQISKILIQFSPWSSGGKSAREFLSRVTSAAAKASNPSCEVISKVRVKGEPFIEIHYENKNVDRIETGYRNIQQILEIVQNKAEEMDTLQKLKAAGLTNQPMQSSWLQTIGKEAEVGQSSHIPRQQ